VQKHLIWCDGCCLLFSTRKMARALINSHYGYIRRRSDLRRDPFGWRIPKAVRVKISVKREGN
jgi:hypothetical protein